MTVSTIRPGTILVSDPSIERDANMGRSVMLVLSNDEEGATALNLAGEKLFDPVQQGGPENNNVIYFLRKAAPGEKEIGGSGYTAIELEASDPQSVERLREASQQMFDPALAAQTGAAGLIMGRTGWYPRQMEFQMQQLGFWSFSNATVEQLLSVPAEKRWELAKSQPAPGPAAPNSKPRGRFDL